MSVRVSRFYSFRSSEIAFFDLSRNVAVVFKPITVVVVVSLTEESLFLYGSDGGQYNLILSVLERGDQLL